VEAHETLEELTHAGWVGLHARDPYGEPLGTVLEVLQDRSTGAPEWLLIASGESGPAHLAPIARALLTGRNVRVAAVAAAVQSAPTLEPGAELDLDAKRAAAAHYGMELDTEHSPTGQLRTTDGDTGRDVPFPARDGPAPAGPKRPAESQPSESQRAELVRRLAAAHAMEQASLKLLAAMRRRVDDEELVHDLALHHRATRRHLEIVGGRLDALGRPRALPLDFLASAFAYAQAQLGRLRSPPEPDDVRSAYDFEQREIAAYEELERLARAAGDDATARACAANRMDEVAMAALLRNSRLWRDPGLSRGEDSPFEAPTGLREASPRS
jgi:ferritin-like metal-binding protein YciE